MGGIGKRRDPVGNRGGVLWRLVLAGRYDEGMEQNPYESPRVASQLARPSKLARVSLVLGVICCVVSWSAYPPFASGQLVNGRFVQLLYLWVAVWAAVIGPVFTGLAMWNGSSVIRIWGVVVLLVLSPLSLATVVWMLN
jgi:hypothetical protein